MKKTRKKYTREFKEEAVKLITEQGYQTTEAARNLGVNENMLGRWWEKVMGQTGKQFRLPSEAEWEYAARSGGMKEKWAGTSEVAPVDRTGWRLK